VLGQADHQIKNDQRQAKELGDYNTTH
jgi:hypothetical protein